MRQAETKTGPTVDRLPESASRDPRAAPWVVWTLLAILALAVLTDLIFYTGFFASDDLQYAGGAIQLAQYGRLSYITLEAIS